MQYMFQESKIWEGGTDPINPHGKIIKIKATSLKRAKSKLPQTDLGCSWIHICTFPNYGAK